jgi:hypothetical protein
MCSIPSWAHSWHCLICSSVRVELFLALATFSCAFGSVERSFVTLSEKRGLRILERSPRGFLPGFDPSPAFPVIKKRNRMWNPHTFCIFFIHKRCSCDVSVTYLKVSLQFSQALRDQASVHHLLYLKTRKINFFLFGMFSDSQYHTSMQVAENIYPISGQIHASMSDWN